MTEYELNEKYFKWMYQLVYGNRKDPRGLSYEKLCNLLYDMEFKYIIDMDSNRYSDGIDLRVRFGYETGINGSFIERYLNKRPCSVLEMMLALAIRCEEHIMDNPDIGNRTGYWVQLMIKNLGLNKSDDCHFNENYVESIILRFLERNYESNGAGSLFIVNNAPRDLRKVEIWYQMNWYLSNLMEF